MASDTIFRVFDQAGRELTQIVPGVQSVSWVLNEVGQVPIFLPFTDSKCTPGNLKLANRLLVQFGSGLPDWGGVFDVPLAISSTGVTITAYSAEHILNWRVTPKDFNFSQSTPGTIYKAMIDAANSVSPTGIEIGTVYTGGENKNYSYNYARMLDQIRTLSRDGGNDFAILPKLSGNKLIFSADWYESRGRDVTRDVLLSDKNAAVQNHTKAGNIHNRVYVAGAGSTWGTERPVGIASDDTSKNQYGFRELAQTNSSVSGISTLSANAEAILDQVKQPSERLSLTTIDKAPGVFASYDIGDIVKVRVVWKGSDAWGVDGSFRLRSRQWNPNNTCDCIFEDV